MFFVFNIVGLSFDVGSDFATAHDFYYKGNNNWGMMTLIPIFTPFVIRICLYAFELGKAVFNNNVAQMDVQSKKFHELFWHLPFLHPIQ